MKHSNTQNIAQISLRKVFFFGLLCCWASLITTHAQDLYEVRFSDDAKTQYKGLLVLFNDSKMYMRVAYRSEGQYRVVNVDYTSEHIKDEYGTDYLVLVGSNPRFITAAGRGGYNPDHLIFADVLEKPIITDAPEKPEQARPVDAFKTLTKADLTDAYLREFYASNEADYLALRQLAGLEIRNTYTPEKYDTPTAIHLVIVANTAISDIGAGCAIDQRNLESEFAGIAQVLGVRLQKYIIKDQDFNKPNLLNTLQRLRPGSNDVVVFVYRGHGFRWSNQQDFWPQMDMRISSYTRIGEATSMSLGEAYNAIVAKGARLNIVLGDCCNNDVGISQITGNSFLVMQNNNHYNPQKLQQLFIKSRGNLLSCAASPGEYSWVNTANGGFYTVSFLQSLREEISYMRKDPADWRDLMENTLRGANAKIKSCSNCTPQTGKYYYGITDR